MITLKFTGEFADPGFWTRASGKMSLIAAQTVLQAAQMLSGEVRKSAQSRLKKNPSGRLMRSFRERMIESSGNRWGAEVYSDVIYAEIQETGGVIDAKSRLLAVPARRLPRGKWPRHFAKGALKIIPRTQKNGLKYSLLVENKKGGKVIFSLRESVRIKPTFYASIAFKETIPKIEKLFSQSLGKVWI